MAINDIMNDPNPVNAFNAFRKSAARSVNGSSVMVDDNGKRRKKYQGRDIAVSYPDGVFLADFDIIPMNDQRNPGAKKPVAVYAISDTDKGDIIGYTNGGANITRMVQDWVDGIGNGDIEATRTAYKAAGNRVKIRITYEPDSNGNNIQKVEVL